MLEAGLHGVLLFAVFAQGWFACQSLSKFRATGERRQLWATRVICFQVFPIVCLLMYCDFKQLQ